jgi:peptidoglycan/xylan/chitin deacetylase (PgdA/CDA1 family)
MTAETPRQENRDLRAPGPPTRTGPQREGEQLPGVHPSRAPWTLMYHSVDEDCEDPYQLTVTPARFARQMAWLHRRGLRGVAVAELLAAHARGRAAGLVGLTFDDGYADLPRQVLPVLERFGFTATAYVVAGRLGSHNTWDADAPRKPLMSAEQVRAVAMRGLEIGSHGLNHRALTGLPPEQLALETGRSRELLEDLLEQPVTGFCYPYGALDPQAVAAVRDSGYQHAVAIDHGDLTGRWALPRCYVGERDGCLRLRAKRARHRARAWLRTDRRSTA